MDKVINEKLIFFAILLIKRNVSLFILYLLNNYEMIGKCQSCGTSNVEVTPSKENGKEKLLCNQCRPADGAYGY